MKQYQRWLALTLLVLALGATAHGPFVARADDPQGTIDTSKRPPCYPRCQIRPAAPTNTVTATAANNASPFAAASPTEASWTELFTFSWLPWNFWF